MSTGTTSFFPQISYIHLRLIRLIRKAILQLSSGHIYNLCIPAGDETRANPAVLRNISTDSITAYAASVELRFQNNYNTRDPYLYLLLKSLA